MNPGQSNPKANVLNHTVLYHSLPKDDSPKKVQP